MSRISGVFNRDGRPIERQTLAWITEGLDVNGSRRSSSWVEDSVGLAWKGLPSSGTEVGLHQLPCQDGGSLCISFDGRFDNREELITLFQRADRQPRAGSDAELASAAYECWGEGCLGRFLGDFAFAIWDGRKNRLFCARDLVGARPFYYYLSEQSFCWASELRQLLALTDISRQPNEGMIGEYLVSAMRDKEETQYQGILRLPPATCLVVEGSRVQKRRYWKPGSVKAIRYARDEEYAEHLREVLEGAVQDRLRSPAPVGAQLSGGVDSSSVVAVAEDLRRRDGSLTPGLEAFSLEFPGWDCDESGFIDDVVRQTGVASHRIVPRPQTYEWYAGQVERYLDFPDYPNGTMSDPLLELAQARGIRVMLTGLGGDEWFQRSDYHLADLLRQGRVIGAIRRVRSLSNGSLFAFGLSPLVPETLKATLRRLKRPAKPPDWLQPDFVARSSLLDRLRARREWGEFANYAQAGAYYAATQGFQTHAIEMEDRSAAAFDLELRYPFHDRRVIELGLGLPEEQRWRDGVHKFVLRQAMKPLLPESVWQRRTKGEFSRVFLESLRVLGRHRFESLRIEEMGWVDGTRILEMYDKMETGFGEGDSRWRNHLWHLWHVFGLELWVRGVFD